jgi:hypothetical protein
MKDLKMLKFFLRVMIIALTGWATLAFAFNVYHDHFVLDIMAALGMQIIVSAILNTFTPLRGVLSDPIIWSNWGLTND